MSLNGHPSHDFKRDNTFEKAPIVMIDQCRKCHCMSGDTQASYACTSRPIHPNRCAYKAIDGWQCDLFSGHDHGHSNSEHMKTAPNASVPAIDVVNHPPHYTAHPSGVECITVTEHMNFCRGNAVKYIWRAGEKTKEKEIEDLKKARWYIDREIARLENEKEKVNK